jgi:hypothetical protein
VPPAGGVRGEGAAGAGVLDCPPVRTAKAPARPGPEGGREGRERSIKYQTHEHIAEQRRISIKPMYISRKLN